MNSMGVNEGEPQEARSDAAVEDTTEEAYAQQPPANGYPAQYGYPQPGQPGQPPYQQRYGYQQPYPQQGAYRGAGGYPQQGAPYGYPQQGSAPAGQYSYKSPAYGQNTQYQGPGPGQYDYRAAQQHKAPQPPAPQQGQYGYNAYQQYPYQQGQGGYGYYPQQYGQPNQQYPYPQNQTPYGFNAYQQAQAQQALNYPDMRAKMPNPPVTENGEAVIKAPQPKKEDDKPKVPDGEIVREELSPDGKKKIVVRRVAKNGTGGEQPHQDQRQMPSKFVQNQIKAELGEDALSGKDQPIVMYKSKMKKKPDKEGVYEPSLRDMFLGPPKKEAVDRDPDPFEWKCPKCGTINPDTVGTCQCGTTQRDAKAIMRRQRDIAAGKIPPDAPAQQAPAHQAPMPKAPMPQNVGSDEFLQYRPLDQRPITQKVQAPRPVKPPQQQTKVSDGEFTDDLTGFIGEKGGFADQPAPTINPQDLPQFADVPPAQVEKPAEPEPVDPDYDPEMPEKVELTEEEIAAEINEFMSAPVQVWRPAGAKDSNNEIYVYGDKKKEQEEAEAKAKAESEISEKAKAEDAEKSEEKKSEPEKAEEKSGEKKPEPAREEKKPDENKEPEEFDGLVNDHEWKCSQCGHLNSVDEAACKCGHKRGKRTMSYQEIIAASRKKAAVKKEEPKEEEPKAEENKPAAGKSTMSARTAAAIAAAQANAAKENEAEEAKRKAEEEAKRQAEEEAKRQAEEEARRKAEEEAKRQAEEEARRQAEEEARRQAEEEARRKAEEEARRKAEEEARRKAEEEARRKAEEEAKRKAEEEAKRKAEEEAKRKAEEEAKRKAEEEAKRKAEEEARIKAEEEARIRAEEEARVRAEAEMREKIRAEIEAKYRAEEEARIRAEMEAKHKSEAEAEKSREDQEAKTRAEEEKAKEEAQKKESAEARRKAESLRIIKEAQAKMLEEERKREEAHALEEQKLKEAAAEDEDLFDDGIDLSKLTPLQRSIEEQKRRMALEARMGTGLYSRNNVASRRNMNTHNPNNTQSKNDEPPAPAVPAAAQAAQQNEQSANRMAAPRTQRPQRMNENEVPAPSTRSVPPVAGRSPEQPRTVNPKTQQAPPVTRSIFGFKKKPVYKQEREATSNEWKCPECGLVNANYVTTCACGYRKSAKKRHRDEEEVMAVQSTDSKAPATFSSAPQESSAPQAAQPQRPVRPAAAPRTTPPMAHRIPQANQAPAAPAAPQRPAAPAAPQRPAAPAAPRTSAPLQPRQVPPAAPRTAAPAAAQRPAAPAAAAGARPVPPAAAAAARQVPHAAPRPAAPVQRPVPPPRRPAPAPAPAAATAPAQEAPAQNTENGLPPIGTKMDMSKEWMCFRCHRTNASYVTTCACGVTKRRCARFYETGEDPYAAQEEEDKRKAAEREKALEAHQEKRSSYGPKLFDDNVVVEVEQVSRQSPLERKMSNMFQSVVDKASRSAPENEDRLERYRQQQPDAAPKREDREPKFDEWKCPNCGTINNKYTDVCSCGFTQQQARLMRQGAQVAQVQPAAAYRPAAPTVAPPKAATQAAATVTPPPIPQQPQHENRRTPPKSVFASMRHKATTSPQAGPASSRGPGGAASRMVTTRSAQPVPQTQKDNDREPYFDEWKCPECGTINNDYVTACSCGCTQRRAKRIAQQGGKK